MFFSAFSRSRSCKKSVPRWEVETRVRRNDGYSRSSKTRSYYRLRRGRELGFALGMCLCKMKICRKACGKPQKFHVELCHVRCVQSVPGPGNGDGHGASRSVRVGNAFPSIGLELIRFPCSAFPFSCWGWIHSFIRQTIPYGVCVCLYNQPTVGAADSALAVPLITNDEEYRSRGCWALNYSPITSAHRQRVASVLLLTNSVGFVKGSRFARDGFTAKHFLHFISSSGCLTSN